MGAHPTRDLFAIEDYRRLFSAQVIALFGTGMTTVALGLLAYSLAGPRAGAVLGTALTLKMVAYVIIAPIAAAYVVRVNRRAMLVALDIIRAAAALALPWIEHVWQVYVVIVVLQSASAAFTPTFQATIPDVVKNEAAYTRALSASQLSSTMESLLSPLLAAAALLVLDFHWLFAATTAGFVGSAILVASTSIPDSRASAPGSAFGRTASGMRIFLQTPRLRGVLGLNLTVAAAGAIVIVSTVNVVRDNLSGSQSGVSALLAASGAGTMAAALVAPRLMERFGSRSVMSAGGATLVAGAFAAAVMVSVPALMNWLAAAAVWISIGAGMSLVLTPVGQVLRRSSAPADRPSVFAAQFSLSHLCWLVTYPIAGWIGTVAGLGAAWIALAALAGVGVVVCAVAWPRADPNTLVHVHDESAVNAEHLVGAISLGGGRFCHSHTFVIDAEHDRWPAP